eukprot:8503129-Pyramimonas_sp.AAC.1
MLQDWIDDHMTPIILSVMMMTFVAGVLLGCWIREKWTTMMSSTKLNLVKHTNTPNRSKELINK